MAVEIVLPRLGWTMEEGTFVEWLKKDGDEVKPGDLIYVVESDKTTAEVENFDTGILRIVPNGPAAGARIPVGFLLAYVAKPGEVLPFESGAAPKAAEAAAVAAAPAAVAAAPVAVASANGATAAGKPPAISPRARKVAGQLGVDWSGLKGSGSTGRIVERDVRAAAASAAAAIAAAPKVNATPVATRAAADLGVDLAALAASMPGKRIERADVERYAAERVASAAPVQEQARPAAAAASAAPAASRKPMSSTRKLIAERMTTTLRTVAPVTLTTEVDATELVKLRESLKADAANSGTEVPSYNDLLAKIAATALAAHPQLNARIEGDEIVIEASAHIGIAVDTDRGLLVVVVRDAQDKTVRQIAQASKELIARAKDGKATMNDLRGSTFSITNLGVYDIDAFTPIINAPECAILGVGRIVAKPVIVKDKVKARKMLALSLTFDHRLVDGAPAARFLQRIKQLIETPYLWLAA
jgi:pyruvate dehydrogenase E2 component (dihydrolipoamide acetyltransferase)